MLGVPCSHVGDAERKETNVEKSWGRKDKRKSHLRRMDRVVV